MKNASRGNNITREYLKGLLGRVPQGKSMQRSCKRRNCKVMAKQWEAFTLGVKYGPSKQSITNVYYIIIFTVAANMEKTKLGVGNPVFKCN